MRFYAKIEKNSSHWVPLAFQEEFLFLWKFKMQMEFSGFAAYISSMQSFPSSTEDTFQDPSESTEPYTILRFPLHIHTYDKV